MLQIPEDKRYFRIGEASRIIGVEPYVLRYWEGVFRRSGLHGPIQTRGHTEEKTWRPCWR